MLQIATFRLPEEQDKANAFLATHKPAGDLSFNNDLLFIGWEDGSYPPEYQIAQLHELLLSARASRFQQEVALRVMDYEIADLNRKHNKNRYEEIDNARIQTRRAMSIQDTKAAFVEQRIKEIQDGTYVHGGNSIRLNEADAEEAGDRAAQSKEEAQADNTPAEGN